MCCNEIIATNNCRLCAFNGEANSIFYQQHKLTKAFFFSLSLSHTKPKNLHRTAPYMLFFPFASIDILTPRVSAAGQEPTVELCYCNDHEPCQNLPLCSWARTIICCRCCFNLNLQPTPNTLCPDVLS